MSGRLFAGDGKNGQRLFSVSHRDLAPKLQAALAALDALGLDDGQRQELLDLLHPNWHRLILARKVTRIERDPRVMFSLDLSPSVSFVQLMHIMKTEAPLRHRAESVLGFMRALDASTKRRAVDA